MNTTATFSSDHSWSRRCSTETIFSIQGKETDIARDTSDTDAADTDRDVEYEPVTEPEDEPAIDGDTSEQSDMENIIATKVIEVSVGDDGDLVFADSEQTDSYESDSEMDLYDFWNCARCHARNNTPLYRYCQKCFKVRKNFFPPRPKRKHKREPNIELLVARSCSQDSGVEFTNSPAGSQDTVDHGEGTSNTGDTQNKSDKLATKRSKRRADCTERNSKRIKISKSSSDSETDDEQILTIGDTCNSLTISTTYSMSSCSKSYSERLNETETVDNKLGNSNENIRISKSNSEGDNKITSIGNKSNERVRISKSISDNDTNNTKSNNNKNVRVSKSNSESESEGRVQPLVKTVSDPAITIETMNVSKRIISNTLKDEYQDLCVICVTEPKSGVFVHGRIAHICCCYKCAMKVWVKAKRCPVCNCKVSNVLKAVVM